MRPRAADCNVLRSASAIIFLSLAADSGLDALSRGPRPCAGSIARHRDRRPDSTFVMFSPRWELSTVGTSGRTDLDAAHSAWFDERVKALGSDRIMVSSVVFPLARAGRPRPPKTKLDPELLSWMAFAYQKIAEVANFAHGSPRSTDSDRYPALFDETREAARRATRISQRTRNPDVRSRSQLCRPTPCCSERLLFAQRSKKQHARFRPSGTTDNDYRFVSPDSRSCASLASGVASSGEWTPRSTIGSILGGDHASCVDTQEAIGLDVLVHGEFERNDMVEYFGEQLVGFAFTE